MWNLASHNRGMINRHAFWEIRDGSLARFWEEAWQQRERLNEIQALRNLGREVAEKGMILVKDFWKIASLDEAWRTWKKVEEWREQIEEE